MAPIQVGFGRMATRFRIVPPNNNVIQVEGGSLRDTGRVDSNIRTGWRIHSVDDILNAWV